MRRIRIALLLAIVACLLAVGTALAQTGELTLGLSRDWGYGGFGNDIQGLFSMKVSGPDTLVKVEFYIDETRIGEVTEAPFRLQFSTDDYPLGEHTLYALGTTSDGAILRSNELVQVFVPASEGGQAAIKIILPVLVVVGVAMLLAALLPVLTSRSKVSQLDLGAERKYGIGGGAICPKCQRPFSIPFLGMNLGFSKFTRCPYCGKWSMVRPQSLAALRKAEQAELEWAKSDVASPASEDEKLRKEVDDSRFQDL
jgi:hypothetical protein